MIRRSIHFHEASSFNRSPDDDSMLLPAGAGVAVVVIMVLAMLWLFSGLQTAPAGEPKCPPVDTDLIVKGTRSGMHEYGYGERYPIVSGSVS